MLFFLPQQFVGLRGLLFLPGYRKNVGRIGIRRLSTRKRPEPVEPVAHPGAEGRGPDPPAGGAGGDLFRAPGLQFGIAQVRKVLEGSQA